MHGVAVLLSLRQVRARLAESRNEFLLGVVQQFRDGRTVPSEELLPLELHRIDLGALSEVRSASGGLDREGLGAPPGLLRLRHADGVGVAGLDGSVIGVEASLELGELGLLLLGQVGQREGGFKERRDGVEAVHLRECPAQRAQFELRAVVRAECVANRGHALILDIADRDAELHDALLRLQELAVVIERLEPGRDGAVVGGVARSHRLVELDFVLFDGGARGVDHHRRDIDLANDHHQVERLSRQHAVRKRLLAAQRALQRGPGLRLHITQLAADAREEVVAELLLLVPPRDQRRRDQLNHLVGVGSGGNVLQLAHLRAHAVGGGGEVRSVVLEKRLEDRALPFLEPERVNEHGQVARQEVGNEESGHAPAAGLGVSERGERPSEPGGDDRGGELGANGADAGVLHADHGHLLA